MVAADSHQPASLQVAAMLDMPASTAATQTFGIIGAKGSGKSYTARRLVEQLIRAGAQVIIIEPIGNWWSLRLAADGVSPGIPIPVIGGMHADIPLDLSAGEALAEALLLNGSSAVIDVSEFSKTQRKAFVAEFAERVYRAARLDPKPRMIVFEEAQVFAPQHAEPGERRMLGAVTDIVRLGRNYGLGSTLITQRPQSVNKEVLNQVECLFVGQLRGPHERKSIIDWVSETGADATVTRGDLDALPTLQVGEFFLWSPSWLRVFRRVRILATETFDGSSTPKLGAEATRAAQAPTNDGLAERIEELRFAIAPAAASKDEPEARGKLPELVDTAEKLRREFAKREADLLEEIAELRRKLQIASDVARGKAAGFEQWADALARQSEPAPPRPKLTDPCPIDGREGRHEPYLKPGANDGRGEVECIRCGARGEWGAAPETPDGDGEFHPLPPQRAIRKTAGRAKPVVVGGVDVNTSADTYQHELLAVLCQHGALDLRSLAFLAGKSHRSSTFKGALRALKARRLVRSDSSGVEATEAGKRQGLNVPALPRGKGLLEYWVGRLPEYEALIVRAFNPDSGNIQTMTREALAQKIDRSSTSSSFKQAIRTLQRFGILEEDSASALLRQTEHFRKAVRG